MQRIVWFVFLSVFSFSSFGKLEDRVVLKIDNKVYFFSELKELHRSYSKLNCLGSSSLFVQFAKEAKGLEYDSSPLTVKLNDIRARSEDIDILRYLLKIQNFARDQKLSIGEEFFSMKKAQKCYGENFNLSNLDKEILFVEFYLKKRFQRTDDSKTLNSLSLFINSVDKKVKHEELF